MTFQSKNAHLLKSMVDFTALITIANGLRKINYYSYMSKAGTQAVKELLEKEDVTFFHDLALAAEKAMSADAEKAMRVFAGM